MFYFVWCIPVSFWVLCFFAAGSSDGCAFVGGWGGMVGTWLLNSKVILSFSVLPNSSFTSLTNFSIYRFTRLLFCQFTNFIDLPVYQFMSYQIFLFTILPIYQFKPVYRFTNFLFTSLLIFYFTKFSILPIYQFYQFGLIGECNVPSRLVHSDK